MSLTTTTPAEFEIKKANSPTALYAAGAKGLLSPLEPWLGDDQVSEILINRPQEVWIEKHGQMTSHNVPELNTQHLLRLFQLIANECKQLLSPEQPLLSGSLYDGTRVQLVLPPAATHPTLSIRRQVVKKMQLQDYVNSDFYANVKPCKAIKEASLKDLPFCDQTLLKLYQEKRWADFILAAILAKKNIVISGGTSSGKTTFLNACLAEIPESERIITLEDTREIHSPHPNTVHLIASKGGQGEAKVSMQDLVQCCLRLRPDRIIMGEIRGAEILDFVSSCSTGHEGSITSIHANNPQIAFMRMVQLYKLNQVPSMTDDDILRELNAVIDIIIQIQKQAIPPYTRQVQSIYYRHAKFAKFLKFAGQAQNQTTTG